MIIAGTFAGLAGLLLGAGGTALLLRRKRHHPTRRTDPDALTGAMTFEQFRAEAPPLLAADGNHYALWYCDIKKFKQINDLCGYEAGDQLLRTTYSLLAQELGAGELICRLSADNFACLVRYNVQEEMSARFSAIAARLAECRQSMSVNMAIGFYGGFYPVDGGDANLSLEEMLDRAHIAQESVKRRGDHLCALYSERMRARLLEDRELEAIMEDSLRSGEFAIYLQPIVDLSQGGLYAAEALVRWLRPDGTRLSPDRFIHLFEKNGFIIEMDAYVFEQVCLLQQQRLAEGKPTVPITVNLSRNTMSRTDFVDRYCAIREKYDVPAGLLVLESSESVGAESMDWYLAALLRLRSAGFLLALDDYGSGYASPALLKDFHWDVVKLDSVFFSPSDHQQQDEDLVRGLVRMCRSVGAAVIAEGVEEQSQVAFLEEIGCNAVQGYAFSRPVSLSEFDAVASRLSVETKLEGGGGFRPADGKQDDRQLMLQAMQDFWHNYWKLQTAGNSTHFTLGEELVFVGTALQDQVFGGRSMTEWLRQREGLSGEDTLFRLSEEWYRAQPVSARAWMVYGGFTVAANRPEDQLIVATSYMRFTAVLAWEDEALVLRHLHASVPDRFQRADMFHPLADSDQASELLRQRLTDAEHERDKAVQARVLVDEICHCLSACSGAHFLLVDMANGRLEYDGDVLRAHFDIDPEALPGDASSDPQSELLRLVHPDDRIRCLSVWTEAEDDRAFSFTVRLCGRTGVYFPLLVQVFPLEQSGLLLAIVRDQDTVRHLQAADAQHPGTDGETGLWNRTGGRAAVDSYLAQPGSSGLLQVFLVTGAQVAAPQFTLIMREAFPGDNILMRLEDNCFAAFIKRGRPSEANNQKAEHLCQRFNLDAASSGITCSVTEAYAPEGSAGFDTLYDKASRGSSRTPLLNIPTAPT